MARYERFTFLCNKNERRLIEALAEKLQRSQSDAVRFVIMTAVRELEQISKEPNRCEQSEVKDEHSFDTPFMYQSKS